MAKVLVDGQQIRTTMDKYQPVITVGSVEGSSRRYNDDVQESIDRAVGFGHDLAFTIKSATCICANYPGKSEDMKKKSEVYHASVLIEEGEEVTIENRNYTVKYVGIDYSNPIKFVPVENKG